LKNTNFVATHAYQQIGLYDYNCNCADPTVGLLKVTDSQVCAKKC